MQPQSENCPGVSPSQGTIRVAQVLSSGRGANAGLHLHPQGVRLVSVWCGQSGGVEFRATDSGQALQAFSIDADLTDVGARLDAALLPPGSDIDLDHWPSDSLPIIDSSANARGGYLAVAAGRGVRVFKHSPDEAQLLLAQTLRGHDRAVTRVAIDALGQRVLSGDDRGELYVWNAVTGAQLHALRISTVPRCAAFIWNSMLAMCGDDTGRVVCWELEHGKRHLQFQAHEGPVVASAFNEDSGVLVTAGADGTARMWNLEEGQQIGRDMVHRSPICDVTFAYAGRFVVTVGVDGHVAVWNATEGDLIDWYFDSAPVYRVAFDQASGSVVVAGARTIKMLAVDWQRLREIDADARSSIIMDVSPADHAAMFASPPARPEPNYRGPSGERAPIGSVMTARQTADLPLPDRSEMTVRRPGGTSPPRSSPSHSWPGTEPPTVPRITSVSSVGPQPSTQPPVGSATPPGPITRPPAPTSRPPGPTPTSRSYPPGGFPHPASRPPGAFGGAGSRPPGSITQPPSQSFSGVGGPSLAEAMASAQQRELAASSSVTSYGLGNPTAADPAGSEADSFFNPAGGQPAARMSSVDGDLIRQERRSRSVSRSAEHSLLAAEAEASGLSSRDEDPAVKAARDAAQRARRQQIFIATCAAVVVLVVGVRFGVEWYFANKAWPVALASQVSEARTTYDAAAAAVEREFSDWSAEERANIAGYRTSGSMSPEAAERAMERVENRIAERRARVDETLAEERLERDDRLAMLRAERQMHATRAANISAFAVGCAGLIFAILLRLGPLRTGERKTR